MNAVVKDRQRNGPAIASFLVLSAVMVGALTRAGEMQAQSGGVAPGVASAPGATTNTPSAAARIVGVAGVSIPVGDLDRSLAFYTDVLAFVKVDERELAGEEIERVSGVFGARCRVATLRLGEEAIELTQFLAPEGRPIPVDSRSNDRWFQHIAIVVSDMDRAYAHLRAHKVRHASSGPQTLPRTLPNAAGISAFYFKDPDGHALEVIHFPKGKGDERWHTPTHREGEGGWVHSPADGARVHLFLGIDHTAIAVGDTESSLRFYRDTLGMTIAGESENFGTEQEHLNNVFGARLRITTLKAPHGPGVELLQYLAPSDDRPYPADSRANDLWQWHTILTSADVLGTASALRASRARFISVPMASGPASEAFMARDPDGHAILIRSSEANRAGATP